MSPAPRVHAGDRLAGRYVLRALTGHGPLGECYLADDMSTSGQVVLKLISNGVLPHAEMRGRFVSDALRFRAVESKYVARLIEAFVVGIDRDGSQAHASDHAVLVFERLPGFSLRRLIDRRLQRGIGAFPAADLRLMLEQLCSALEDVHRAGLVHGNVKPENVFLTSSGVRLTDLGVAPALGARAFALAERNIFDGRYVAPEICRGAPCDVAGDVHALGFVLSELVGVDGCGQLRGGVPAALGQVLRRARAANPGERFPSVRELAASFIAVSRESGVEESREGDKGVVPVATDALPQGAASASARARQRVITAMGRAVSALTDEDIEELEPTRVSSRRPDGNRPMTPAASAADPPSARGEDATMRTPLRARRAHQRTVVGASSTILRHKRRRPPSAPGAASSRESGPGYSVAAGSIQSRPEQRAQEVGKPREPCVEVAGQLDERTPILADASSPSRRSSKSLWIGVALVGLAAAGVLGLAVLRNVVEQRAAERDAVTRLQKLQRLELLRRTQAETSDLPTAVIEPARPGAIGAAASIDDGRNARAEGRMERAAAPCAAVAGRCMDEGWERTCDLLRDSRDRAQRDPIGGDDAQSVGRADTAPLWTSP